MQEFTDSRTANQMEYYAGLLAKGFEDIIII